MEDEIKEYSHHPVMEKIVEVLQNKTQTKNDIFFKVMVAYYLGQCASNMRTSVYLNDRGVIPVNIYSLSLAVSGFGKGMSTNIMEDHILKGFRDTFLSETFRDQSELHIAKMAHKNSLLKNVDPDTERERLQAEFARLGTPVYAFDSGTAPALKQLRQSLLMASAGAISYQVDEIGNNLLGQTEILDAFLELYDVGKIKSKLTKNTKDNPRGSELEGRTPANMLLYGTPVKLLNGAKEEQEFMSMLDSGYARRCLFAYVGKTFKESRFTAEELYEMGVNNKVDRYVEDLNHYFTNLANIANLGKTLTLPKETAILLYEYRNWSEERAEELPEHETIRKTEITHRYFKAVKLAGAYAFVDGMSEVTQETLQAAIKLVEESGNSFYQLLNRERNYEKLAKYIAACSRSGKEVTDVDISEDLPFYKGADTQKRELMQYATAWGYKNQIMLRKQYIDGIPFYSGDSLEETDLDRLTVSWSKDIAKGYTPEVAPWSKLDKMYCGQGLHWCSHHFKEGHRKEDNAIAGFNIAVFDIDGGTSLDTVKILLKDFTYAIYTTPRHTEQNHRFRLLLPLRYSLKLNAKEYTEFMTNMAAWLPFEVDAETHQRSRKWVAWPHKHLANTGKLLNPLKFIPRTAKNDEFKSTINNQQSLNNLERWFINNTAVGNRSNQLIRYAFMLVDSGMEIESVKNAVLSLNSKLKDKLDEVEVFNTIILSATRKYETKKQET